jgi:hypothetical protein
MSLAEQQAQFQAAMQTKLELQARENGISVEELKAGPAHSFPLCLLMVYQCTRTRSPHPPPWPHTASHSQLNVNVCLSRTSVPVNTRGVLLPGLTQAAVQGPEP